MGNGAVGFHGVVGCGDYVVKGFHGRHIEVGYHTGCVWPAGLVALFPH